MTSSSKTKLVLGRETLRRLDGDALDRVHGGAGAGGLTSKPTGRPPDRKTTRNTDDPSCYIGPCCNG
jgi:hypothetical protein